MDEWIVVIPKNRSLKGYKEILDNFLNQEKIKNFSLLEVRGEDIPFFVSNLIKKNNLSLGIVGEDLFKEWQLENTSSGLELLRRYEWKDKEARFNKPVLCLLGPKGKTLQDLPKNLKVCISDKYKRIAKRYLNSLETLGYRFEKKYLSGAIESTFQHGIADLVIDIVSSGKSAEEAGLECYDKIFESDIVIIGKRDLFDSLPKIKIIQ